MSATMMCPVPPVSTGSVGRAKDLDLGHRQRLATHIRVELGKMVDTRSGRWLIAAILGLAAITLGWCLTHIDGQPIDFAGLLNRMISPVDLILPVLGIMAMTSEWTQRTALATFTLSPRRFPVLGAKLLAAVLLAVALDVVVALM